jgi:hypothetical protein
MRSEKPFKRLLPETAIGVKDFRTLVEEFLDNKAETQLITYPRRWGKSVNMNMIKTFLEIEVDGTGSALALDKKSNTAIFSSGKWVNGQKFALNIWQETRFCEHF